MPENNDKESQISKIRLFPVVWGIAASVFLYILTSYKKGFSVLSSLGSFTFTMSFFLILITVFYELNKHSVLVVIQKQLITIIGLLRKTFKKRKSTDDIKENPQKTEIRRQQEIHEHRDGFIEHDDLIEIRKGNVSQPQEASVNLEKRIYEILYIIAFLSLAFWRISGMFKVMPLSYVERYRPGVVEAVLLLVFPCVSVFYLKMRKDDFCPTDKIFHDILTLFSYVSFVYAAVIAAASVLNLNILVVLPWVYYAASVYLAVTLAVNILLSILQGNILSFDYTLFPKELLKSGQTEKWKVSLKSLYTIRYTLKIVPALALALFFVLFISTSFFVVQPHQQAVVYHFGKLNPSSIKNEGLHFKFPWPVDKTEIYDVHRAASMQIGYESSGSANFLWTRMHDGGEHMLLLGGGNEMAAVNLKIIYVISDLYSYIKTCTKPELVLSAAAYNALMSRTVDTTLDSFLNVDRNSLSVSVLNELSEFCKAEKLGFSVVQVIVESIHPPVDIADVYQKVVSSSVDKTTLITKAQTYAETKIMEAQRQSKTAVIHARAVQYSRVSDAEKEMTIYYAAMEAYRTSPVSFELTRNLDVYEKIINSNKVYVFSPGAQSGMDKFIIGKVNTVNLANVKGDGNE